MLAVLSGGIEPEPQAAPSGVEPSKRLERIDHARDVPCLPPLLPLAAARRLPGEQGRRITAPPSTINQNSRRKCRRGRRQCRDNVAGTIGNDVKREADKIDDKVGDVDVDVDINRNTNAPATNTTNAQ